MAEKLGEAVLELRTDDTRLEDGVKKAKRTSQGLQDSFNKFGNRARNVGAMLSFGITAPLTAIAAEAVNGWKDHLGAIAQVEAGIKSMGNQAGLSSDELADFADSLEFNSLADADDILRKSTANLLTFGNVAGAVFKRAQQAAVDMSERMGTDLQSSTILIGKALNDPIKGLTALTRVGIQFTEAQKAQIEAMSAAGDMASAQGIILTELERQYGGAAKAAADTDPMHKATIAWRQLQDTIGEQLLPLLPNVADGLASILRAFNALPPGVQTTTIGLLAGAAAIGPLMMAVGTLASGIGALIPLLSGAGLAGALGALGTAAAPVLAVVAALAAAWALFGDKVGPVLSELWEKAQAVLGPAFQQLIETASTTLSELWNGPLGDALRVVIDLIGQLLAAFTGALGETLIRLLSAAAQAVGGAFQVIGDALKIVTALLRGDWAGAWNAAKALVANAIGAILRVVESLTPGVTASMHALYTGVKTWLQDKLGAVFRWVEDKLKAVGKAFFDLYDAVVGHSYVPDLVEEVGDWFAKLDGVMVKPALDANARVGDSFDRLAQGVVGSIDSIASRIKNGDWLGALGQGVDLIGQLTKLGGNLFGGKKSGGGIGDVANSLASIFGGGSGFAGLFANGGLIPSGSWGIVGERGPEPVIGTSRGTMVLPNSALSGGRSGGGSSVVVEVQLRDAMLDARVREVSGDVAAQVVRGSAGAIVDAASAETARRLFRPRM